MKNLCIDIGNTNVKVATFIDDEMIKFDLFKEDEFIFSTLFTDTKYDGVAISSVGKEYDLQVAIHNSELFINLDHSTPSPIQIEYQTPETLGRDRIAAAIGAWSLYRKACCVVDAGTCVTLDFIDSNGIFKGGNISPGLHMRLLAMHQFTDRLPLIHTRDTTGYLGRSTEEAMKNGAIYGLAHEIDGFFSRLTEQNPNSVTCVMTGGSAEYFKKIIKRRIFVHSKLILIGLNEVLQHNHCALSRAVHND